MTDTLDDMRRRSIVVGVGVAGLVVVGALVAIFQPHKLFIDEVVEDERPDAVSVPPPAPGGAPSATTPAPLPVTGTFVSLDHGTSGVVEVFTTVDGERVLRFEDLATDNGPDLFVYLSTAPADGSAPFDADFIDLGALKGNVGNQNYVIPAGTDLERYATVVIWCRQFTSAFGAAELSS